ncbi:MAG: LacI family DNA-binding transcriptional regulator [Deltaproteobacteria bacterium]|nr:LacI family DNA-binding transcriptional regulator [Candidatus Zymogenaceae bacterium]
MTKENHTETLPVGGVKTLQDIAALCGVSASTVSRVLNSEPNISRETTRRVMDVVGEYGFTPVKRKRSLARSRAQLCVVVPDSTATADNPFFDMGELLQAIGGAFGNNRKSIETVSFSELETESAPDLSATDGVIFAFGRPGERTRSLLVEKRIPYIFLNRIMDDENYVSCNHYKGALRLRKHLEERGCGRVGYLGCTSIPVNGDRRRGYETGTREAGVYSDDEVVCEVAGIGDVGADTAAFFVKRGCDGVMCFNDNFAIRFVAALSNAGVSVPGDMKVTGFDDSPQRRVFTPTITTISLSTFEMGFFAARWLRDNIQHRETRRLRLEVEGSLLTGETTMGGNRHD